MIEALRTPDERFANLPRWPFPPRYVADLEGYEGLRVAYVDEGPKDASRTFLCLHGQPSWSYLYRYMIPVFLESGARVSAPDLLGFGRSDKPVEEGVYTVAFHRRMLLSFIRALDLRAITLVVQDWGGLLGLTLPLDISERIDRLLIMNTAFPDGGEPGPGFRAWRDFSDRTPDMAVGELFRRGNPALTPGEVAAYDAPFPDTRYKAGVRRFPRLVPIESEGADPEVLAWGRAARAWWSESFTGASFMAVGGADPVLGQRVMENVRRSIRGCPPPMILPEAGHFVQEHGEPIARAALRAWGDIA